MDECGKQEVTVIESMEPRMITIGEPPHSPERRPLINHELHARGKPLLLQWPRHAVSRYNLARGTATAREEKNERQHDHSLPKITGESKHLHLDGYRNQNTWCRKKMVHLHLVMHVKAMHHVTTKGVRMHPCVQVLDQAVS